MSLKNLISVPKTQKRVLEDWENELRSLDETLGRYRRGEIAGQVRSSLQMVRPLLCAQGRCLTIGLRELQQVLVTFYREFERRKRMVPSYVIEETKEKVAAMAKEKWNVNYTGQPLTGFTGVDQVYDSWHYDRLAAAQERRAYNVAVETDEYKAARILMESKLLQGVMTPPAMYDMVSIAIPPAGAL